MAFQKYYDRLERMHRMIKFRRTGTPDAFAEKMGVSVSMLYKLVAEMKQLGAPISYCHLRQSYQYSETVELQFGFKRPNAAGSSTYGFHEGASVVPLHGRERAYS